MSGRVFFKNLGPFLLSDIAKIVGFDINPQHKDVLIHDVRALEDATSDSLTFLVNKKYTPQFCKSAAVACIVSTDFTEENDKIILIKSNNPYYTYSLVLDMFYVSAREKKPTIMKTAYIAPTAKIGKNCYIGHNVVIEDNVEIGNDCVIESGSIIGYNAKIGDRARINNNVSISHAVIGDDFSALPGVRIGQSGFGFSTNAGIHTKIYHTGRVMIGNDVEVGANTTIDRGSMNDTIIEDLCRIDNLVQIAHNVHVKKGTILVAQVGIAGSCTIGSYCALGGQVGISGHVKIADGVQIAGQGGVLRDVVEPDLVMGGTPAVPIKDWHKQTIMMKKLIKGK